jgi:hypothetical protein
VAQSVEQLIRNQQVTGSNPVSSSNRLSLDAICVPGSVFHFAFSLAFSVGIYFGNASHTGGEQFVHRRFFLFEVFPPR